MILQAHAVPGVHQPSGLTMKAVRPQAPAIVIDGHRYRTIETRQALLLAIVAAALTPVLVWLAL